jgi:hypothetical protein
MLMSSTSRTASAAIGLAAAGLLLGAGGLLHPRVDHGVEYEQGLAGMFESSAWVASHAITLTGFLVLAVALAVLVRDLSAGWASRQRLFAWAAAAGAVIAAVESVPHLLAESERHALLAGESTPLTDLHAVLQAVATPAVGLSVAALALASARNRTLGSGRIAAAVAVVGGAAFAVAGPAMAISENSALSPLFAGSAGLSVWLVVSGIRTARRLNGGAIDRTLETAPAR